jgi:hypothetical protein
MLRAGLTSGYVTLLTPTRPGRESSVIIVLTNDGCVRRRMRIWKQVEARGGTCEALGTGIEDDKYNMGRGLLPLMRMP